MGMLTSAGVVDTGRALIATTYYGQELSVKFLLLQQQKRTACGEGVGYLETFINPSDFGGTPLACSIRACRPCSPRIARLLVDAGANTTTAVRISSREGVVIFHNSHLALVDLFLNHKKIAGKDATEEQLHSLQAMRRLLMRVEAVHAVSWLWASDVSPVAHAAAEGTDRATERTSTPLMSMLPVLKRRTEKPRVLLAALFRNSNKP